jgi:hypothetical protein
LAGGWPDEAVEIEPLVAVMATGDGAAAAWRPDLTQDRLQAEAMLIERPDFDRNRRFGALKLGNTGLELFFYSGKASCLLRLSGGVD